MVAIFVPYKLWFSKSEVTPIRARKKSKLPRKCFRRQTNCFLSSRSVYKRQTSDWTRTCPVVLARGCHRHVDQRMQIQQTHENIHRACWPPPPQSFQSETGVKNVSDHGTIGPRKFLGLPENILAGGITTV